MRSYNADDIEITRIKNDVNGNGRLVVHFFALLTVSECDNVPDNVDRITYLYDLALNKAKKIGGRKYHTKTFGGGIVFTDYESNLRKAIKPLLS